MLEELLGRASHAQSCCRARGRIGKRWRSAAAVLALAAAGAGAQTQPSMIEV